MADTEDEGKDKLTVASVEAADLVLAIMRDQTVPPEVRLAAAEITLAKGDLAARIGRLEQEMAAAQEKFRWSLPNQ
jgi:hypothetical protein